MNKIVRIIIWLIGGTLVSIMFSYSVFLFFLIVTGGGMEAESVVPSEGEGSFSDKIISYVAIPMMTAAFIGGIGYSIFKASSIFKEKNESNETVEKLKNKNYE